MKEKKEKPKDLYMCARVFVCVEETSETKWGYKKPDIPKMGAS